MHLNVNGGSGSTGCLDVRTRLLCFDAARNHFRASPRKMAKKMKRRDIHRRVPQCCSGGDDVRITGIPGDLYSFVKTVEGSALDQGTE